MKIIQGSEEVVDVALNTNNYNDEVQSKIPS